MDFRTYLFTFFLLLLHLGKVKCDVLCETAFCRDYEFETGCAPPAQECANSSSGIWLPSPITCNCCRYCLPLYGAGEECSTGGPGTGTTVGRCGAGLACVKGPDGIARCTRMQSTCQLAQDDYDSRHSRGETGALEVRPVCDGKGRHGPYHCMPTQTCFCQSEDGERIFGEAANLGAVTLQSMHCGCSRFHEKIKKLISPGVTYPVVGPRCTSDGNFNPIQCVDRVCYCVNRITGTAVGDEKINLDETPVSELPCFNPSLDPFHKPNTAPPFDFTTPCLQSMRDRIKLIGESLDGGFDVGYYSAVPQCLPDGTYGRVATTRNGTKICVDEYSTQIESNYEASPNTPQYDNMDCKCAQTSQILAESESPERPVCCSNGNFRPVQCRRGECYCVDQDGRQIARENTDVTQLDCYSDNWKTC